MTNYEEAVLAITGLNGYQIGTRALQVIKKLYTLDPRCNALQHTFALATIFFAN